MEKGLIIRMLQEQLDDVKRLFISDTGMIHVHPFIRHLFQNMELVDENGKFVSRKAGVHAVHLLRHVTGSKEPHFKHMLTLEKVLCGLPVGYVIPVEWGPSIDWDEIASKYELTGGAIMNVVQFASVMAMSRGQNVIRLNDVVKGIRREYHKEGKMV